MNGNHLLKLISFWWEALVEEVEGECSRWLQIILIGNYIELSCGPDSWWSDLLDHLNITANMMSRIMMIKTKITGITWDSVRTTTAISGLDCDYINFYWFWPPPSPINYNQWGDWKLRNPDWSSEWQPVLNFSDFCEISVGPKVLVESRAFTP